MQYGLISKTDAAVIEKTLDLIMDQFPEVTINTLECGLFNGDSSRGIHQYLWYKGRLNIHTGIDNEKDKPIEKPFPECNLIIGNSHEVYFQVPDNSQHFIFIDANHSYPSTIQDFFCYADKVKKHGYISMHDTSPTIKKFKDYQRLGSADDPDMYIAVRKALTKIGLMNNTYPGWELIFDEYEPNCVAGGVCCFKKLY